MRAVRHLFGPGIVERLPALNAAFAFCCFALPPVVGSGWSIAFHGCAIWALIMVASGRVPMTRDRDVLVLSAAFAVIAVAHLVSFAVNGARPAHAVEFLWTGTLCLLPFTYSTFRIARRDEIERWAVCGAAVAGYAALLLAAVQRVVFDLRPPGGAGNAIVFASIVGLTGLIALAGALARPDRSRRFLLGGYFSSLGALGLGGSRAIWIAVIAGTIVVAILWRSALAIGRPGRAAAVGALVLLLLGPLALPTLERFADLPANWADMTDRGNYASELGERIAMWRIGAELFADRPLLGHASGLAGEAMRARLWTDYGMERGFTHFHNDFLTLGVEAGLLAALALAFCYLYLAAIALRTIRGQYDRSQRLGATILLSIVIVYSLTGLTTAMHGHDLLDTVFVGALLIGLLLNGAPTAEASPNSGEGA